MSLGQKLKHFFIPHKGNDYTPHFFRETSVAIIAIVIVVLFGATVLGSVFISKTKLGADVYAAVLVDLTNQQRTANSEATLTESPLLVQAATLKAADMAQKEYFAHTSPDGLTPWYWFQKVGYTFFYAGENLAVDFTQSQDVENAWMNSPEHRANILNGQFTEIGIAVSQGTYQGHPATFVVQEFGTPAFFAATPTPSPTTPPVQTKTTSTTTKKTTTIPKTKTPADAAVKGAEAGVSDTLQTISNSNTFLAVQNLTEQAKAELAQAATNAPVAPKYATWFDDTVVNPVGSLSTTYKIIGGIILAALLVMIGVESKKQRPRNILYGVFLIVLIIAFAYLAQMLIASNVVVV